MLVFGEMVVEAVVVSLQFHEFLNCSSLTPSSNSGEEIRSPSELLGLLFSGFLDSTVYISPVSCSLPQSVLV